MILQNYQNFIEMISNMIYIVALGGGFKCPHKIHLNTQCTKVHFACFFSVGSKSTGKETVKMHLCAVGGRGLK